MFVSTNVSFFTQHKPRKNVHAILARPALSFTPLLHHFLFCRGLPQELPVSGWINWLQRKGLTVQWLARLYNTASCPRKLCLKWCRWTAKKGGTELTRRKREESAWKTRRREGVMSNARKRYREGRKGNGVKKVPRGQHLWIITELLVRHCNSNGAWKLTTSTLQPKTEEDGTVASSL